jgi:hypothetical protein
VMQSPGVQMTVVDSPWKGGGRALYPRRRPRGTPFSSCAPPGRIGWCRPSRWFHHRLISAGPSGTDAAGFQTFSTLENAINRGSEPRKGQTQVRLLAIALVLAKLLRRPAVRKPDHESRARPTWSLTCSCTWSWTAVAILNPES